MIKIEQLHINGKPQNHAQIVHGVEGYKSVLLSYNNPVAAITTSGGIVLDLVYWNYSKTNERYRNAYLNMTTEEVKAAIQAKKITFKQLGA